MLKTALKKINNLVPFRGRFPLNYMVPVYHTVSDERLPHVQNIINYKNSKDFEKDLDFMAANFDFVDWETFKNKYRSNTGKPLALLTFDDGLIEFKDVVMPVLLRKGIYAVNFINPAFVGNPDIMFRMKASLLIERINDRAYSLPKPAAGYLRINGSSKAEAVGKIKMISYNSRNLLDRLAELMEYDFQNYIRNNKIYMDESDLAAAEKEGFGIAAHSWDHPYFYDLRLPEQLDNAQKSINYMRENGFLDDAFAFPFTDAGVKRIFFEELSRTNNGSLLTFGTAGVKTDSYPTNLQRIPMENGYSAEREISFESNYYRIKSIFGKNRVNRL